MLPSSPDSLCLEDSPEACSATVNQALGEGHALPLNFHPEVY